MTSVGSNLQAEQFQHACSVTTHRGDPAISLEPCNDKTGRVIYQPLPSARGEKIQRDVYIYLPPRYESSPDQRYPVIYMHDGQNLWDDPQHPFGHGGWQVKQTADRLIAEGRVPPFIVVGIANSKDRMEEYGCGENITQADTPHYIHWLANSIKPYIDKTYRTNPAREATFVAGASMGGLISMKIALTMPEVFGGAGCMSSSFQRRDANGNNMQHLITSKGKQPVRFYLDHGTAGPSQDGAEHAKAVRDALISAGWQMGVDLHYVEDVGAEHNESAWRRRLPGMFEVLLR